MAMRKPEDVTELMEQRVVELRRAVTRTMDRIRRGSMVSGDEMRQLADDIREANLLCNLLDVDFDVQGLPC